MKRHFHELGDDLKSTFREIVDEAFDDFVKQVDDLLKGRVEFKVPKSARKPRPEEPRKRSGGGGSGGGSSGGGSSGGGSSSARKKKKRSTEGVGSSVDVETDGDGNFIF